MNERERIARLDRPGRGDYAYYIGNDGSFRDEYLEDMPSLERDDDGRIGRPTPRYTQSGASGAARRRSVSQDQPARSMRGGYRSYEASGQGGARQSMSMRGRGPSGWRRSKERIEDEIHDELTDCDYLDATHIEVRVGEEGIVELTGRVGSRAEKRRAEDLIDRVRGVYDVRNQLTIERGGQERSRH